ncbi:MAG: hypothetical protein L6R28_13805 [Planctomycetes bacterium]|nr:hypothetical protein [Planctomycetota bacterium]
MEAMLGKGVRDSLRPRAAGVLAALGALSLAPAAYAAQGTPATPADLGALLGAGLFVLLLVVLIVLVFNAIFIHMASGIVNLPNRSFGKAFTAAIICLILSFVVPIALGLVLGVAGVQSQGLQLVASILALILPGTLAIMLSYGATFVSSLITYIVSFVLTVIVAVVAFFGLVAVMGTAHA